jgi:hypothetical protein
VVKATSASPPLLEKISSDTPFICVVHPTATRVWISGSADAALGASVGATPGASVGVVVGATLSNALGTADGVAVGTAVAVGAAVGTVVGAADGNAVGTSVGAPVGVAVVGEVDGATVGISVGIALGATVGANRLRVRMRLLTLSLMYSGDSLPSTPSTLVGELRAALIASPQSSLHESPSVPAIVLMTPPLPPSTTLIRLLSVSAINTLPLTLDTHTPLGFCSVAEVATKPSPLKEAVPVPAIVVRASVLPDTLRTLFSPIL